MSAVIFEGQVGVTIRLALGIDISAAGVAKIHYKKPDGTRGEWVATKDNPATGTIFYKTAAAADLDQAGVWHFNGEWNPSAPSEGPLFGKTCCLRIYELGECDN